MGSVNLARHRIIIAGSALIAAVVLLVGAGVGGSYLLALAALHNHSNLSIAQSCVHWGWVYTAAGKDHDPHIRAAVAETLRQLKCGR